MPCPEKKKHNPKKHRKHTPITSEAQRGAMGVAYAAEKGEIPKSELRGPAKAISKGMTKAELRSHLKESKGKELPKKKHGSAEFGSFIEKRSKL